MRRKRQYIVLSFASTARAMGWEKECAARGIPGRLIPLPSEITAGCGLGWRMLPEDWQAWQSQLNDAGYDCLLYTSQICKLGAQLLDCSENDVEFDGKTVFTSTDPSESVSLGDIATASMFGHDIPLEVTETHMSPLSPPPYICLLYTSRAVPRLQGSRFRICREDRQHLRHRARCGHRQG